MKDFITCVLLLLLALPFMALTGDASGRSQGLMIKAVFGVAVISLAIACAAGGLYQRPNAANLVVVVFLAWPVLILIAKGYNPALRWGPLLLSVPAMSWYLVILSILFYYPASNSGLGAGLALLIGWSYMAIPFIPLCGLFLVTRATIRSVRKGRSRAATTRRIKLCV